MLLSTLQAIYPFQKDMPFKPGIIYINSTLCAQQTMAVDKQISPIHNWGYFPETQDKLYCHRINRSEILLRYYLGGVDLYIFTKVLINLITGYKSIYLVTQPDLIKVLPLIRRLFPKVKILTWAWNSNEVLSFQSSLKVCDHVFCLTEAALEELKVLGLGYKSSLQIWGVDPNYYIAEKNEPRQYDVCLIGLTNRDFRTAISASEKLEFKIGTTRMTLEFLSRFVDTNLLKDYVQIIDAKTHQQVLNLLRSSNVAWILLVPEDPQPTGYTNLVEALLCGTAVVIADSSTIPTEVLSLPGVYLYKVGCVDSLIEQTKRAKIDTENENFRRKIQNVAARVLNAVKLRENIRAVLCE